MATALDDQEVFHVEGRLVVAEFATHEEFERRLGGLELRAQRLSFLDAIEDAPRLLVGQLEVDALLAQFLCDVAPAREFGDEHPLDVADGERIDVGIGAGRLRDRSDV